MDVPGNIEHHPIQRYLENAIRGYQLLAIPHSQLTILIEIPRGAEQVAQYRIPLWTLKILRELEYEIQ